MSDYSERVKAIRERQDADRRKRRDDLQSRLDAAAQVQQPAQDHSDGNGNGFWSDTINNIGKIGTGLVDSATAIPRTVLSTVDAAINKKEIMAELTAMDSKFKAGELSKDDLKKQFDDKTKDILGLGLKVTSDGIVTNTQGDRMVNFAKQTVGAGVDTASVLPIGGAVKGLKTAKEAVATGTKVFSQDAVKQIALNNIKQAAVFGTASTANNAVQNDGSLTPGNTVMNYLAPAALGTGSELAGRGVGKLVAELKDIHKTVNPQAGSIRIPGGKTPDTPPIVPEVPPTAAPTPPPAVADDAIAHRLNPNRTNPAGLPETLPQAAADGTKYPQVVDANGTPAFVQGRANPKVFGDASYQINDAKDNYIAAVKSGDADGIQAARDDLIGIQTTKEGTVAKESLIARIDDYATSVKDGTAPVDNSLTPAGKPYTTADEADARMFNREQRLKDTKAGSGDSWIEKADKILFDKNADLKMFDDENFARTGKHLKGEDNPHSLAALIPGAPDAAKEGLRGVFKDMLYVKKNNLSGELMRYGTAKQIVADRSSDYPASVVAEMQGTINRIEADLPPQQMQQIEAARRSIVDYHNEQLIRHRDEGILSKEWYNNIKGRNTEYFTGFNFEKHTIGNEKQFAMTNSLNNSKNPFQSIRGIDDAGKFTFEDPSSAIPRQAVRLEEQLARHRVIDSINRLTDANPDSTISKRLTTPESIDEAIDLNMQNKGLRPIRDGLTRAVKRDARTSRKLETVINGLNKKGLNISLRDGGSRLDDGALKSVDGVGGDVATSKTGGLDRSAVATDEATNLSADVQRAIDRRVSGNTKAQGTVNEGIIEGVGINAKVNDSKLGASDTARFFKHLIENNSRSKIDQIKKAIGNKDTQLTELMDNLGELRSQYDDISTQVTANRQAALDISAKGKDVPDGYEVVETWQDGKKVRTAVLQPIADALKGKNDVQLGLFENIVGKTSKPFRAAVTIASPGFAPAAGLKDLGQLLYSSKNISLKERVLIAPAAIRWARGVFDAVTDSPLAREAAKNGMGGANTLADSTENVIKEMSASFGRPTITSTKDLFKQALHVMNTPARGYMKAAVGINRNIEYGAKLAEYRAALGNGKSGIQAAVEGRGSVADSQNSGIMGRLLNQFVPFTNMTLQGTGTVLKAAKRNPAAFAAVAASTAAVPTIAAYAWNQTMYPEVYNDISPREKEAYFLIVLGDNKDAKGNYTDVLKIPKTEITKVLSAPLEAGLAAINGEDHDSIVSMLLKTVGWLTPVQIERNGEFSGEAAFNSTALANPLVKAGAELASNHDFYTGNDVTPSSLEGLNPEDQVKANTPAIDKIASKVTGGALNPLQAGVVRKSVSGNLASTDPITQSTKRFVGASSGAHEQQFYQLAGQTRDLMAKANFSINKAIAAGDYPAAYAIAASYKQKANVIMSPWVKEHSSSANIAMKDTYDGLRINLTSASVKARLKSIAKKEAKAAEAK